MGVEIVKLIDKNTTFFDKICEWNYNWWGKRDGYTKEEVISYIEHSLSENRIPQTFIALYNDIPVGMYQFAMFDDASYSRPDLYPWLVNLYVEESYRGRGICRHLMKSAKEEAKRLNVKELFLYTEYSGLYEKFGWEFIEEIKTFNKKLPVQRLYRLIIK